MNTLDSIVGPLISLILPGITTALLVVLGALTSLIFGVWGCLKLINHIKGKDDANVAYQMGRLFGDLVHEEGYQTYKRKRDKTEFSRSRSKAFNDRYNRSKP